MRRGINGVDSRARRTGGTVVIVGVVILVLGLEPKLVLLGFVALVAAATAWLVIDLAHASSAVAWHEYGAGRNRSSRPDHRLQFLKSSVERAPRRRRSSLPGDAERSDPEDEIATTLVELIDSHLLTEHGLDRAIEPEAAAEILGPHLTRFVSDPSARRSMTRRRSLAGTLSLIEDL